MNGVNAELNHFGKKNWRKITQPLHSVSSQENLQHSLKKIKIEWAFNPQDPSAAYPYIDNSLKAAIIQMNKKKIVL